MVKNSTGGCKSKKLARKLTTNFATKKEATRFSQNELEHYALVTKIYGNGRCQVKTNNLVLSCVIRNKFKGRSKRGNVVTNGSYILIGLREWETTTGFKTCDLLEIYDTEDVMLLNNDSNFKLLLLNTSTDKYNDDGLFSMDDCLMTNILKIESTNEEQQQNTISSIVEDFNFDDI